MGKSNSSKLETKKIEKESVRSVNCSKTLTDSNSSLRKVGDGSKSVTNSKSLLKKFTRKAGDGSKSLTNSKSSLKKVTRKAEDGSRSVTNSKSLLKKVIKKAGDDSKSVTNSNSSLKKVTRKPVTIDKSKTFIIYEKRRMIEPLRNELLKRGWCEQVVDESVKSPKFVWLSRSNAVAIEDTAIVNRLKQKPLKNFCHKDILINYGRDRSQSNDNEELNLPRTFKLFENESNEFIENYRLTAYSSLIRFLKAKGLTAFAKFGKINPGCIHFAINKLEAAIASDKKIFNANDTEKENCEKNSKIFSKFKNLYQRIVKFNSKIKADIDTAKELLQQCDVIYEKCKRVWKDFENDGFYNLWLLKPARRSLGIGIRLFDDDVDMFVYAKDLAEMKYLAQKYVERPMLIYNTKFDLRQYFLIVHHVNGICLWMYKMCYLKFSTKLYDPLNYEESVHLTNTAIQSKYSIDKNRSTNIPQCNEWSSERFMRYLKSQDKLDLWHKKIYPAMKRNILATVSAAVDVSMIQPNHFQLYGCDFVIDDNFEPILLEINGFPILTSVICPTCLGDLVKVVIDKRDNPSADTGHFEKIWEKKF